MSTSTVSFIRGLSALAMIFFLWWLTAAYWQTILGDLESDRPVLVFAGALGVGFTILVLGVTLPVARILGGNSNERSDAP